MTKNAFPRESYYPKGATIIRDKKSSAVAAVYDQNGKVYACMFQGKANKPASHYRYKSAESRAEAIARYFAAVQEQEAGRIARRAQRKACGRGLEVGDVLRAMWGYEQTNIDYYEVTALIGTSMVEVRAIGYAESVETHFMQGNCIPAPGKYIGEPMRRKALNGAVAIDSVRHACKVEPAIIAGAKVFSADHWTAYA